MICSSYLNFYYFCLISDELPSEVFATATLLSKFVQLFDALNADSPDFQTDKKEQSQSRNLRSGWCGSENAETFKRCKYANLGGGYTFVPFGVETFSKWRVRNFQGLAKRLVEASGEQNAGSYFAKKFCIAIQRGNAASILDTLPPTNNLLHLIFLNFCPLFS